MREIARPPSAASDDSSNIAPRVRVVLRHDPAGEMTFETVVLFSGCLRCESQAWCRLSGFGLLIIVFREPQTELEFTDGKIVPPFFEHARSEYFPRLDAEPVFPPASGNPWNCGRAAQLAPPRGDYIVRFIPAQAFPRRPGITSSARWEYLIRASSKARQLFLPPPHSLDFRLAWVAWHPRKITHGAAPSAGETIKRSPLSVNTDPSWRQFDAGSTSDSSIWQPRTRPQDVQPKEPFPETRAEVDRRQRVVACRPRLVAEKRSMRCG